MTGRRVIPFVLGLWAGSAAGQGSTVTHGANASFTLDAGGGLPSAYVVTGGTTTPYAMANGGGDIEVFNTAGVFINRQPGVFSTFAVADAFPGVTSMPALVFAADVGTPACATSACIAAFLWTPVGGFVAQTPALTNGVTSPSAMAVDTTTSGTIRVYFVSGLTLYEQDFTVNSTATGLVAGTLLSKAVDAGSASALVGLAPDENPTGLLYLSDGNITYYVPKSYPASGGTVSQFPAASSPSLNGLFFQNTYLLGGNTDLGYVAAVNTDGGEFKTITIVATTLTPNRDVTPYQASENPTGTVSVVTEGPGTGFTQSWLHIVLVDLIDSGTGGPDAGADAGADAGPPPFDSGVPTIPIVPPGQGQLTGTANSCNCSSAGSAPVLLAFLLPLLLPRRRR